MGRYNFFRLHPVSLLELNNVPTKSDVEDLLEFGGFPEMITLRDKTEWKKWQRVRVSRVIKDDLLSLEQVKEVSQIELLAALLIDKAGGTLSLNSLREDLKCSHEAVSRWVSILENVYYCYRISPYGNSRIKALKKEQKLFLWDWSTIPSKGSKFENLVASNLLKYCHYHEDVHGEEMELRYIRDKEKREIDFVAISSNDVDRYPQDGPSEMKKLFERLGLDFPYLYDETQEVSKSLQAQCTPEFYLYDSNNELVYRGRLDNSSPGKDMPITGADLRSAIEALLKGETVSPEQHPSMGCSIKWK